MTRARSIEAGDATAGVRVEYVKTRRVVRLGGWHGGGREMRPLEVPASRFLDELGIEPEELNAAPAFLVLAAVQDYPGRGFRHLAAAFPSEITARELFLRLRADHQRPGEWAQVVALDARCRLVPVCWFGTPGVLNSDGALATVTAEADPPPAPRARRWAVRRLRG